MNVIVIVSDTFRRDHLGAYGNPRIHTPHLDRFASESVVFDGHHVGSFPTMPARADLMTGRLSCAFMTWEPLPKELPTVAEAFKSAGYLTTAIVDTPFYIRNGFGYDRGFHDFFWIRGQGDGSRPEERADARSTWVGESDRYVARTMTAAENWLERHADEKFFLVVDTWDPHEPWNPPDYYTRRYLPDYEGGEVDPPYALWREVEKRYQTTIEVFEGPSPEQLAAVHGDRLWERNPDLYLSVAKVAPLVRALGELDAWITGIRRDQATTRASAPKVGWDEQHELWKAHPLADWSSEDCWAYIRERELPYNPLHDRGYDSIGDTHATQPGSGRAGRWAGTGKVECGIHTVASDEVLAVIEESS